jgi:hypothetical protein
MFEGVVEAGRRSAAEGPGLRPGVASDVERVADIGEAVGSSPTPEEEALVRRLDRAAAAIGWPGELVGGGWDDRWDDSTVGAAGDAFLRLRAPSAADLAAHETGSSMAFRLEEIEVDAVDDYAAVEVVAAWSRLASWAQAGAARAAAHLARRPSMVILPTPEPATGREARRARPVSAAAHEIAMRLMISRRSAQAMIDTGKAIDGPLAFVGDAVTDGLIDMPRARTFVEGLADVPLEVALDVQDELVPIAPGRTVRQLRTDIARALVSTDPQEATSRHRVARDRRRVCHPTPLPDGMAGMWAVLPAPDAVALDIALEAAARTARSSGDSRTTDQLRADILGGIGHSALATGWFGTPPRGPAETVPGAASESSGPLATSPGAARLVQGPVSPPSGEGSRVPGEVQGPMFRVGSIGGRPAQIRVTVPLADLLPGDERGGPRGAPEPSADGDRLGCDGEGAGAPSVGQGGLPAGCGGRGAGAPAEGHGRGDLRRGSAPIAGLSVAELDGYGPITPDVARALALGGVWKRLVTDPSTGVVRDVGRTRYEPPADLAELVRARDGTCVRPGCSVRAQGCDLDHTTPYHLGGHTADWNLGALCPTDHALKSAGGVTVRQVEPGVFEFELPSGHVYRRRPDGTCTMRHRSDADVGPPPF